MKADNLTEDNLTEVEAEEKVNSRLPTSIIVLALVLSIATAGFFAYKYYSLRQDPSQVAREELQNLVDEVGKLIELPNEESTIATVVDAEALRSQPFFAKAQKGDKVLIYPKARKAILYSPSLNKIIEVGPVVLGDQGAASPAPAPTPAPTPAPSPVPPKK